MSKDIEDGNCFIENKVCMSLWYILFVFEN